MAKHIRLTSVKPKDSQYTLCLEKVIRDNTDGRTEYAFVLRDNDFITDEFALYRVYFDWHTLGSLIRKAVMENKINENERKKFYKGLTDFEI
ncbi:MAG: hypothetical protein WC223_09515 [Bacteroidales bacterium]|jgi:hypothetical protein